MRSFKLALLLCCLTLSSGIFAQSDTCNLKVSLLTCGPGEDLYSIFGHSALRVTDTASRTDIIYNYGTFDFEDPDFYIKFVRGKLLYYVSAEQSVDFVKSYKYENRFVIEQTLSLTCEEKHRLFRALRVNSLEENKYYLYQFLFDNCSTRLRDIVRSNANDSIHIKNISSGRVLTFREILHVYFQGSAMHWSQFGIDLLLGSRIDRKMTNEEMMFLPDYLMKGFDSTIIRNNPLVTHKQTILPSIGNDAENGFTITPLLFNIILLAAGILLLFTKNMRLAGIFDTAYFFLLGVIGVFILFMWFGTDHDLCRDNYNLLWAIPFHLIFAFLTGNKQRYVQVYFGITAILGILILISWSFFPQGMNYAFIPLITLSVVRSIYRALKK